jgi:hypothetical protein
MVHARTAAREELLQRPFVTLGLEQLKARFANREKRCVNRIAAHVLRRRQRDAQAVAVQPQRLGDAFNCQTYVAHSQNAGHGSVPSRRGAQGMQRL